MPLAELLETLDNEQFLNQENKDYDSERNK